jgi:hypothetical protein
MWIWLAACFSCSAELWWSSHGEDTAFFSRLHTVGTSHVLLLQVENCCLLSDKAILMTRDERANCQLVNPPSFSDCGRSGYDSQTTQRPLGPVTWGWRVLFLSSCLSWTRVETEGEVRDRKRRTRAIMKEKTVVPRIAHVLRKLLP